MTATRTAADPSTLDRDKAPKNRLRWDGVFKFGPSERPEPSIRMAQVDKRYFRVDSRIEYLGVTGLEDTHNPDIVKRLKVIEPGELLRTDLASVPAPLRWFVDSYGWHTPAALIHDRLIPVGDTEDGLTDVHADAYFRHMLAAVGVPWIRRWLMWTAVAYRTRHATRRASVIVWTISAVAGMIAFVVGLATGNPWLIGGAAVAPIIASALWSGQYRAGLMAAIGAPFILPPAIVAATGYGIYWILERFGEFAAGRSRRDDRRRDRRGDHRVTIRRDPLSDGSVL